MRRALSVTFAFISIAACGTAGGEAGTATLTGATITSGGHDLPRNLSTSSDRIATEVCNHEEHCGRVGDVSACMDATARRATDELRRWNCQPAAIRARFEECLVSFDGVPCELDLRKERRPLCPENRACEDFTAHLVPPGPELAKIWR
jgi:hypothetical protein